MLYCIVYTTDTYTHQADHQRLQATGIMVLRSVPIRGTSGAYVRCCLLVPN